MAEQDQDWGRMASECVAEMSFKLGRAALLDWLRAKRRLEPWFVSSAPCPTRALAESFVAIFHGPGVPEFCQRKLLETYKWARKLVTSDSFAPEEMYPMEGLRAIGHACDLLNEQLMYQARFLHLRVYVLRVAGQTSEYMQRLDEFAKQVEEFRQSSCSQQEYEARLYYELGCFALYGFEGTRKLDEQRMEVADRWFRKAQKATESHGATTAAAQGSVEHVIFGALRNRLLIEVERKRFDEASALRESLNQRFGRVLSPILKHDLDLQSGLEQVDRSADQTVSPSDTPSYSRSPQRFRRTQVVEVPIYSHSR